MAEQKRHVGTATIGIGPKTQISYILSDGSLTPRSLSHVEGWQTGWRTWEDVRPDHILTPDEALAELQAMDERIAARRAREAAVGSPGERKASPRCVLAVISAWCQVSAPADSPRQRSVNRGGALPSPVR
jgi:hypothetical protein